MGTLLRYGVGGVVQRQLPLATFPDGTLVVNLLGCLVIGGLAGLIDTRQVFSPEARGFALIGVLGGFTTYSPSAMRPLRCCATPSTCGRA